MRLRVPGVESLHRYERRWLTRDLTAGLVLGAVLVPQGMAYAELAGLPPITGLYTSILCMITYAVFGPSRILIIGPDSAIGPMIAATIIPLVGAHGDPARALALASLLSIMVGVVFIVGGLARLGFIADLLSRPTQIGYLTGVALIIAVSQLPRLFGFSVHATTLLGELQGFLSGLRNSQAVPAALAVGLVALALLLVLQRWLPQLPGALLVVVISIAASALFNLSAHGVAVVGTLPKGFPPFGVPHVAAGDLPMLIAGALAISLVALTDTISTATAFSTRRGEPVRPNEEMRAIGLANIATGFFHGFAVGASATRTTVADRAKAKTQLAGLIGAVVVILMLLVVPGLLRDLPQPTLAALLIAGAIYLADLAGMRRLWHLHRAEFAVSLAAFLGVALLGVLRGVGVAVALAIFNVFRRSWWPYSTSLGRLTGVPGFHDTKLHPEAQETEGVILFRFDAPLFFANARAFREDILELARSELRPRWIVVAAEPMTDVDTTAVEMLVALDAELAALGVSLLFAEMKREVRDKVERYGLTRPIAPARFFPTRKSALAAIRRLRESEGGDE